MIKFVEGRCGGVDVGIAQSRYHRAPLQINQHGVAVRQSQDPVVGTDILNPIPTNRDRFRNRKLIVDGNDLPVMQNQIRLRECQ